MASKVLVSSLHSKNSDTMTLFFLVANADYFTKTWSNLSAKGRFILITWFSSRSRAV